MEKKNSLSGLGNSDSWGPFVLITAEQRFVAINHKCVCLYLSGWGVKVYVRVWGGDGDQWPRRLKETARIIVTTMTAPRMKIRIRFWMILQRRDRETWLRFACWRKVKKTKTHETAKCLCADDQESSEVYQAFLFTPGLHTWCPLGCKRATGV